MNTVRKTLFAVAVSGFVAMTGAVVPGDAKATGLVAGATEPTQILNNIQLILSYANQIQQLSTQIQQYENMLINTASLPFEVWNNVQSDLQQIAHVVDIGQGLSYTMQNLDQAFKDKFQGYKPTTDFSSSYRTWSQTNLDTVRQSLSRAKLQADQFGTEEGVLRQLRNASSSATGQLQAIQAGHQIAEQTVQQLQKLRELMITQMTTQDTFMAAQASKDATIQANEDQQLQYTNPTAQQYQSFTPGVY